jgi:hypothetical protein
MTAEQQASLDRIVADLVPDLQPLVAEIEKSLPTTRNHYGRYMSLIGSLSKGSIAMGKVISLALVKAGANAQGVQDAFKLSF